MAKALLFTIFFAGAMPLLAQVQTNKIILRAESAAVVENERTSPYPPFSALRSQFSFLSNCDTPVTFIKKLGSPTRQERAFSMCQSSDGHIYIAGKQGNNPMIAKITPLGTPIWVRNFPGVFTTPIELAEILEDSEGMLVVCGTEGSSPIGRKVMAMRYDPTTNNVLWYKRFNGDRPIAMGILEKGPGSNFILLNNIQLISGPTTSNRVEYWEIDRSTGSAVENLNYNTLTSLTLSSMVLHNGSIYGVGDFSPGNNSERRPLFIKISPDNGLPEWVQETEPDTLNTSAKVFSNSDIAFDGDLPILAGNGQIMPTAGNATSFVYLEKHAADGSLMWMKRYELPMEVDDVVAIASTYYVSGRMTGSNRWGMFKTDKDGNLLKAKELTAALPYTSTGGNGTRQNLMLPQPSGLLMLDYTWEEGDNRDILLARTDFDFRIDDSCSLFKNLTVSSQNLSAKLVPVGLGVGKNTPFSNLNAVTAFQEDSLTVSKLCPECFPDPCHPHTFLKIFGRQGSWINLATMRAAPDGNLYLAGLKDDHIAICKMAPDGHFLWTRSLAIVPSERITLSEIIVDSEGMIVGSGNLSNLLTKEDRGGFAFRYHPSTDQVIWAQRFNMVRSTEGGILEKTPGGNFLLYYNATLLDVKRPEILELDRATGQIIPAFAKRYEYQHSQVFNSVVAHDGALYATGSTTRKEGNNSFFRRMTLSKLDAQTGNLIWSQTGPTDWLQPSGFVGADLIVDGNSLITVSYGSETNNNPVGNAIMIYLQKTTLDGEVLWVKKYNLLASLPQELVATPDGYVIFTTKNRSLLKTDKDGNILVSKQLNSNAYFFGGVANLEQNQVEQIGQHLYFAHETARNNQIYGYTTLFKTDLNLNMEFECELSPFSAQGTILAAQVKVAATQIVSASPNTQQALVTTTGKDQLVVHQACPACPSQACTDLPDLTAHVDSILCSATDGAVAKISICNLGSVPPPTGFHLTFYAKNPLKGAATRLQSVFLEVKPDSGQCIQVLLPLNAALLSSSKVYTLAGVDNNVLPPIELGVFPFANGFAECDYANNLDSFELKLPAPQKPNLGPDRSICQGDIAVLDAGSGYVQYNWNTGATSQTISVATTGNYWVQAVDACGRTVSDTVQITILPSPKRSVDLMLLPGDSVTIGGNTYYGSATVIDSVPSLTGGCDTVVTYMIQLVLTEISLQCPANLTVTLPPNTTTTVVDYTLPTANTSCPNPAITFQLLQGPPVGGVFPQGTTQLCYEASNQCGIRDTCCFSITAQLPDPPCDLKTPVGCIRYELLGIRQDALGQRRYRVRMTNTCSSPLEFVYIQLPNGLLAVSPKDAATYTAPAGNAYTARNPNASPFYSVRYKALTGSLNNGKSDIFEYTLPQQAHPAYIHVSAKLADGTTSETHLNTFYCPEVMENLEWRIERNSQFSILNSQFSIWPNPTDGTLFVHWGASQGAPVEAQVFNAQGQLVLSRPCEVGGEGFELRLPEGLASGLYYLRVSGQRPSQALRFVLER